MKKLISIILTIIIAISMTACGSKANKEWQEQYDLGMRYLSEMDYENAILAFTAAIQIDPKRAPAYISLARTYTSQGNREKAKEVLQDGYNRTDSNKDIESELEKLNTENNNFGQAARTERSDFGDGGYVIYEYDENGNLIKDTWYNRDGSISGYNIYEYDENGNLIKQTDYNRDGSINYYIINEYDENGNLIKYTHYNWDGSINSYNIYEYDENGKRTKETDYNRDGSINSYNIYEYDENGNPVKDIYYSQDGSIVSITEYD